MIDIGINLMHRSFASDREQVMEAARQAGVDRLIITGTDLRASDNAARLAGRYPGKLYSTAGVHPHDAKSCDKDTLPKLRRLAALPQVVAIGECGLDFDRNFSPPDVQREWFAKQLELSEEVKLPLFLHERSAHRDFLAMLREHPQAAKRAVVHCFTGSAAEAYDYLSLGCLIGVTGWICDERRSAALRDAVRVIPTDRLMIETDAPFLTPRDLPERPDDNRNEPKYLPHILKKIAFYMECDPIELEKQVTENTEGFFCLTSV